MSGPASWSNGRNKVGSPPSGGRPSSLGYWTGLTKTSRRPGRNLVVRARGEARGANPHGGDNAATPNLRLLKSLAPTEQEDVFEALLDLPDISGAGAGIAGADEITHLTCNLGIVKTVGDEAQFLLNVRYPVTWTGEQLKAKCEKKLAKLGEGWRLARTAHPSTSLWITRS